MTESYYPEHASRPVGDLALALDATERGEDAARYSKARDFSGGRASDFRKTENEKRGGLLNPSHTGLYTRRLGG